MSNSHIMKTTAQWAETSAQYMLIGEGTLCIELMSDNTMNIKIGDGVRLFHELPYISDTNIDLHEYAKIEYVDAQIDIVDREIGDVASDVSGLNQEVVALQEDAHTHENKNVLDQTTAPYTTEEHDKLSGIEDHANNYSLPIASNETLGGVKTGYHLEVDSDGKLNVLDIPTEMIGATESVDGVGGTVPAPVAGQQAKFLRGDGTWATPQGGGGTVTVDDVLSTTSENPVQNKVIALQINTMIEDIGSLETTAHTHDNKNVLDQTTAVYTIDEKSKLGGIENHANNYTLPTASDTTLGGVKIGTGLHIDVDSILSVTVDDVLSTTSENPVQNKVIYTALQSKADLVDGKVPTSQLPPETGGVSSVTTGTGANGTIEVVTNGETTNPAVRGLLSAAYTESTAYLSSSTKYAISNSIGGAANQAKQVYGTFVDYGAINTRYVPFAADASGGYKDLYFNNAIYVQSRYGTVDHEGIIELFLGNNIAAATDQNKTGAISIYGNGNYRGRITIADGLTENRLYSFPNASGEVALTTSTVSSANTLNVSDTGSATQPIYFVNGVPQAITYTIASNVPSDAVFTDTTYAPGTGLSLSGTTINHENSIAPGTAAGSSGTLEFGGTFNIPSVTYDATGHITAKGTTSLTMPSVSVTDTKVRASLDDNTSIAYLLGTTTSTSSMPIATEAVVDANIYIDTVAGKLHATTFEGNGNGLTSLNANNITSGTLNLARTATSGVTAGSYGLMANATPGFGDTFNVPYVTVDQYGRTTAASTKSVTIPATVATTTVAGLMPASAVSKLSGIDDNANNYSLPTASTTTLGGIKVGSHLVIDTDGKLHVTDIPNQMIGATASTDGVSGTVPAPITGQHEKFLRGDGSWATPEGAGIVVDSELSTTSENPVQNKVITTKVNEMDSTISETVEALPLKADLNADGKVSVEQLPEPAAINGYYQDPYFYKDSNHTILITPDSDIVIYVDQSSNTSYRWDGSTYVNIGGGGDDLTLGETHATAYYGDLGKHAYDHSNVIGNAHNLTKVDLGIGSIVSDVSESTVDGSISVIVDGNDVTIPVHGLGSAAYTNASDYLNANTTYAGSATVGGAATSANMLNTNAGSTENPVYFADGIPKPIAHSLNADVPSNAVFTDTTYGASDGILLDTINAKYKHVNIVTPGTAKGTNTATLNHGDSFNIPSVTYDAQGHIVEKGFTTLTLPDATVYTASNGIQIENSVIKHSNSITAGTAAGSASKTLTYGDTFNIPSVTYDAQGHVTGKGVTTLTMPASISYTAGTGLSLSGTTFNHSNSITAGTAAGSSGSIAFGGTITIPKITYDAQGHVTGKGVTTLTMPAEPIVLDEKVKVSVMDNTSIAYLMGTTSDTTGMPVTSEAVVDSNIYIDTTAGSLHATNFIGLATNATHAVSADSATVATTDTSGNALTTYIKGLSVSGKVITYTRGNNTTGTITTQDTTYTAGTGLSLSGTTFNHSNSITAGTAAGSASKTLTYGDTFNIPSVTYDAQGHVTGKGVTTLTMPASISYTAGTGLSLSGTTFNHSNSITAGTAAGSSGSIAFGGTITIPKITYDAQGHIKSTSTTAVTLPSNPNTDEHVRVSVTDNTNITYLMGTNTASSAMPTTTAALIDPNVYIDTTAGLLHATSFSGSGASLSALNATNITSGTLNAARLATSGVTAGSYGLSENATPSFGGQFSVPYLTIDNKGRVTAASSKSVTVPNTVASSSANGLMTSAHFTKLGGIASGAEVNQNAYSTMKIGSTSISATGKTDTFTFVQGNNITLTPNATNKTLTLAVPDMRYTLPIASSSTLGGIKVGTNLSISNGVLSATDTVYTHPSATAYSSGLYKITTNNTGHVTSATAVVKADITALGIPASNTTYTAGTGLSLSGTTFNHSNSITAGTAAGSTGSIAYGGSINIPSITYDAQGHIKSTSTTTVTLPPEITYTGTNGIAVTDHVIKHSNAITAGTAAGSTGSIAFGGSITIPAITYDAQGHIKSKTTTTVTLPSNPNTDAKVQQDSSSTNQYRALLMSFSNASDPADIVTATNLVYMDAGRELYAQPSTGSLYAKAMYADGKEVSTEGHAHDAGEIAWGLDTNYHDSSISNDPVLSAFNERLNPNRFAFANTSGITLEYSRDGGTTWTAYGSDTTKTALVTTSASVDIGNATSGITIDDMVRVTFAFAEMQVYSNLRGAFIYVTTNGATGSYVLPEIQYGGATAWINLIDADKPAATTPVTGWSGWNWVSLKGNAYGSYKTTTAEVEADHVAKLRLTFGITGIGETGSSSLRIHRIYSYGGNGWATPSNLARINHLYDYDESQNANFPNNVTAEDHFIANGNTVYNMFDYVATPVDIYGGNTGGVRVAFGGGATTVVGAGEAKDQFKTITAAAGKNLYLVADQAIYFWSDCDTFDNRKGACYDNGDFRPEIKDTGSLGTDTYHWNAAYINTVYGTLSGNASTATALTSNAGSVTQPIYFSGGKPVATTYTLEKSVPSTAVFTDTKNTAGSTNSSAKLFLIGATSQAVSPQTYSHDTAYVGTDGCLYSESKKVSTTDHTHNYAGSSSAGGVATSALRLSNTAAVGATTRPVYFTSDGIPVQISYTISKSVPSTAIFTDENVKVSATTTANYRSLLLGYDDNGDPQALGTGTGITYRSLNLYAQPSTGTIFATNFNGNATSATYATNVRVANIVPGSRTLLCPAIVSGYSNNEYSSNTRELAANGGIKFALCEGSATVNGQADLLLGTAIAVETVNNKKGRVFLYGEGTGFTCLHPLNKSSTNYSNGIPAVPGQLGVVEVLYTGSAASSNSVSLTNAHLYDWYYVKIMSGGITQLIVANGCASTGTTYTQCAVGLSPPPTQYTGMQIAAALVSVTTNSLTVNFTAVAMSMSASGVVTSSSLTAPNILMVYGVRGSV